MNAFRRLLPVLRVEWPAMIGSYLLGTISSLALAAISVLTAWSVGHAVIEKTWPHPMWWWLICALVILRAILTWREMDSSHALAYRVLARLRMAMYDSFARAIPARRRAHSGRSVTVAMGDIEKLEFFYAHTAAQVGAALTVFMVALLVAGLLLPAAAVVLAGGALLIAATAVTGARSMHLSGSAEQRERAALSARIVDVFGALREVLCYGLAARMIGEIGAATALGTEITRRRELMGQAIAGLRELIASLGILAVLAVGLRGAGSWSLAELPALLALLVTGLGAVSEAAATISQLHPLRASATRVADEIDRPAQVTEAGEPVPLPGGPLGLRFTAVEFGYLGPPVLTDFSAHIAPGEHFGLAGASGSGKSTLVALAARLWDPDRGRVELIDTAGRGTPLDLLAETDLRAAIAVVEQETRLFSGSLRENLLRGSAPLADAELISVLARVGATDWIGLDDELGEGGVRLSGGQRARLGLARALIRRPRVLILDEVTASLDPDTEREIGAVISGFDGTVLVVSHRAETLARMDRIQCL